MSAYLGIDPGKKGYVARIGYGSPDLWPTPMLGSTSRKRTYDLRGMRQLLERIAAEHPLALVVIEKGQPMPSNGAVGNWSSGFGYGAWLASLSAAGLPYEELSPQMWKRALKVTGQGKDAKARRLDSKRQTIAKAQALYPGTSLLPSEKHKKPSDDMAEALLLAMCAKRRDGGTL